MEISGKVIYVSDIESGVSQRTGNTWESLSFVVETNDRYPQKAALKLFGQDRIEKNPVKLGDEVNVSFDINAREYNGRWFNSLDAWNVSPVSSQEQAPSAQQQGAAPVQQQGAAPVQQQPAQSYGQQGTLGTPFPDAGGNLFNQPPSAGQPTDNLPF